MSGAGDRYGDRPAKRARREDRSRSRERRRRYDGGDEGGSGSRGGDGERSRDGHRGVEGGRWGRQGGGGRPRRTPTNVPAIQQARRLMKSRNARDLNEAARILEGVSRSFRIIRGHFMNWAIVT